MACLKEFLIIWCSDDPDCLRFKWSGHPWPGIDLVKAEADHSISGGPFSSGENKEFPVCTWAEATAWPWLVHDGPVLDEEEDGVEQQAHGLQRSGSRPPWLTDKLKKKKKNFLSLSAFPPFLRKPESLIWPTTSDGSSRCGGGGEPETDTPFCCYAHIPLLLSLYLLLCPHTCAPRTVSKVIIFLGFRLHRL